MNRKTLPAPPKVQSIRLDLCDVPVEIYQRDFNARQAQEIADNFDVNKCGVLTVSPQADGRYHVVDGQHRLHALVLLGYETWPAEILLEGNEAEEAAVFVGRNRDSRRLSTLAAWRARRVAGDPVVIGVEAVLADLGLSVARYITTRGQRNSREVMAVGTLEKIYVSYGDRVLEDTLRLAHASWPDDPDKFQGRLLGSLAGWVRYYRDHRFYDRKEAPHKFGAVSVLTVFQRAGARGGVSWSGNVKNSGDPHTVAVLTDLFNHARRSRELPYPTLAGWQRINKGLEPWTG